MKVDVKADEVFEVDISVSEVVRQILAEKSPEAKYNLQQFLSEWLVVLKNIPDESIEKLDDEIGKVIEFLDEQRKRYAKSEPPDESSIPWGGATDSAYHGARRQTSA